MGLHGGKSTAFVYIHHILRVKISTTASRYPDHQPLAVSDWLNPY